MTPQVRFPLLAHRHGPRTVLMSADRQFMALALDQARTIPHRTWPNPPVGAVVVAQDRIVGRGAHLGPGTPHAEIVALAEAGEQARGATLYVTLEPCNHMGHTPPCAPAVVQAGIARVVIAMRDPNPTVKGGGLRTLRDHGLSVTCGVLAEEALDMVWPFVVTGNFRRPYLELKTAVSLDGRFAPLPDARTPGAPHYLTGPAAREQVHRHRRWMDAVLVGEGTVAADDPRLDARLAEGQTAANQTTPGTLGPQSGAIGGPEQDPLPGYLDTDLSWERGMKRRPFLVIAGDGARGAPRARDLAARGAELLFVREIGQGNDGGKIDLAAATAAFLGRGLHTVMIEGGPRLAAAFLAVGLIDRWTQYLAPSVLGRGASWPEFATPPAGDQAPFTLTRQRQIGPDVQIVHDRLSFAHTLQEVTL